MTINLDTHSSKEISFNYATADGTAIAGTDYTATEGTVTFAPGETTKTITVDINADNLDEIDEAFSLNFDNAVNVSIPNSSATVTITDDDNPPEVVIADVSVTETDSSNSTATVTASLSTPSSLPHHR